ncbi:B3 domain-containing protein At3g25182 [Quercus suber]|uniref:B3 domain-containing protein n=1 Tax=Quercus suber TaxID=58331 RepID=A0AAW0LUN7_QUESU|nr:B3 domain-containing protein At3g25182-like [Quercus suber]POE52611.1 b3 domain-containing protein [Quercus suber]
MGGRDKLLVIQKKLFETDITKGNNRFSIPLRQIVRTDFLTEEEKEKFRAGQEIRVQFIDPMLESGRVVLVQWDMPKDTGNTSSTYALRSTWNKVRESNGLKIDDVVQLWSFRVATKKLAMMLLLLIQTKDGFVLRLCWLRKQRMNSQCQALVFKV